MHVEMPCEETVRPFLMAPYTVPSRKGHGKAPSQVCATYIGPCTAQSSVCWTRCTSRTLPALTQHGDDSVSFQHSAVLGWAGHVLRTRPSDTMVQLRQNSPRVVKFLKWRRFEQSSSNLRECTIQVHEQCCDFADLVSFGQTGDVESSASVSVAPSASKVSAGMLRNNTHSL